MNTCTRTTRWLALGAGLLVCLWSCVSHPLAQPTPEPGQESDGHITIVPMRHLDLVFMVDNSPSMKPRQDKMHNPMPRSGSTGRSATIPTTRRRASVWTSRPITAPPAACASTPS